MKTHTVFALLRMCIFAVVPAAASAENVQISSLEELDRYAAKSGNTVVSDERSRPGDDPRQGAQGHDQTVEGPAAQRAGADQARLQSAAPGEGMSPYGKKPAVNIHLDNETVMPVIMSDRARDCKVHSHGLE